MQNQPYNGHPGYGPQGGPPQPPPRERSALWYLGWIFGSFAALVVLFVVAFFVLGFVGTIRAHADQQKALAQQLTSLTDDKEDLDRQLRQAKTPAERDRLEQEIADKQAAIEALKTNQPTAKPGSTVGAGTGGSPTTRPKCNCKPGDALCSCL